MSDIVWIPSENCWATVVRRYAHYCYVSFEIDGFSYLEVLEYDDILEAKDMGINYEFYEEEPT